MSGAFLMQRTGVLSLLEVQEAEGHPMSQRSSEQGGTCNCTVQMCRFKKGHCESGTLEGTYSKQKYFINSAMLAREVIPGLVHLFTHLSVHPSVYPSISGSEVTCTVLNATEKGSEEQSLGPTLLEFLNTGDKNSMSLQMCIIL